MIKKANKGYVVVSEKNNRNLGGPYKSSSLKESKDKIYDQKQNRGLCDDIYRILKNIL